MVFTFGSFIWHVVLDLIGAVIVIILLFLIGDAIDVIYKQYKEHQRKKDVDKSCIEYLKDYDRWVTGKLSLPKKSVLLFEFEAIYRAYQNDKKDGVNKK